MAQNPKNLDSIFFLGLMHENVELEGKKEEKRHLSIHQFIKLTSDQ